MLVKLIQLVRRYLVRDASTRMLGGGLSELEFKSSPPLLSFLQTARQQVAVDLDVVQLPDSTVEVAC